MKKRTGIWIAVLCVAALAVGLWLLLRRPEAASPAEQTAAAASAAPESTGPSAVPEPSTTPTPAPVPTPEAPVEAEPADDALVLIKEYIPGIYIELRYATNENFTGKRVYDFDKVQLRYGTLKKLARVQQALLAQGYSLKIWDAYRPIEAQFKLWDAYPDGTYVANPNTGYSSHSRGNTVDLTLVRADGTEIPMPSDFDDFSALADRDYSDVPAEARENVRILETAMQAEGFVGYGAEWWHFSDQTIYDVVM